MNFPEPISIQSLAKEFNLKIIGDKNAKASGINEIHKVRPGDITFSDLKKYFKKALTSEATFIILNEEADLPQGKVILISEEPFKTYNDIVLKYRPRQSLNHSIDPTAVIHPSAIIEPGVIIGPHVRVGKYSHIMANVVLCEHSKIGEHVTIQHGSIIGSDAFYYKRTEEGHKKWRSCGRVLIEDHVEIGALNTINKGVSGDTIIGEGTKMDCQIHIGHGVVIGKHCLFAAGVAVGGKTIIGDKVTVYGQVGIVHNISIVSETTILSKTLVSKSIKEKGTFNGIPCSEQIQRNREIIALKKLPGLLKKIQE